MSVKRRIKFCCLLVSKYLGCFALARLLTRKGIVILGWHGISMDDEHTRFPQYFISRETLANRLEFLRANYTIISLDEAVRQHASGTIKPRQAVLTFDDGLYDFSAVGAPLLEEYEATGTLYVVSSKIGNALAHKQLAQDIILRSQQARGGSSTVVDDEQRATLATYQQDLAELPEAERYDYLRQIAAEFNVDIEPVFNSRMWNHHQPDELKRLAEAGHGVQLHTHTHLPTTKAPERVYEEANTCREILEKTTETMARDYCYPSGYWDRNAWEPLKKAGVRSAVTCKVGPNFASTPALALRRYIDHSEITQLEFEALVSGWTWLLKIIIHPSRFFAPSETLHEGPPYI